MYHDTAIGGSLQWLLFPSCSALIEAYDHARTRKHATATAQSGAVSQEQSR